MDVFIVRHAIAYPRNPRRWRDDARRPLTPAGIRRFRKAAQGLERLALQPERVLTSPLVRARQTAEILTSVANWPKAVECAALVPRGSSARIIGELRMLSVRRVAVVGHEPGLSRLIGACIAGTDAPIAIEMKKGGVACVSFPGEPRAGRASLKWLIAPRTLRAVR